MSAIFSLDQVLACTESATSEYSTTSQCLSALLGRPGRVKFILDGLRRFSGFWFVTPPHSQRINYSIQAVCSNKVAQKRLTETNRTPAMDLRHMNVVLK